MTREKETFNAGRRRLLTGLGVGAAGTAFLAASGSSRLFARQFTGEAMRAGYPKMVYDPALQMTVDPVTRKPVYDSVDGMKVASGLPIVTTTCDDCPKNDGTSE